MKKEEIKFIVEEVFEDYFTRHNFKCLNANEKFVYGNNFVQFIIYYDTIYGSDATFVFKFPDSDQEYIPGVVHKVVEGCSSKYDVSISTEVDRIKIPLLYHLNFIEKKLPNLHLGEFNWKEEYIKEIELTLKLDKEVWNLPEDHPIRIKKNKGDQTWFKDLEELLSSRQ